MLKSALSTDMTFFFGQQEAERIQSIRWISAGKRIIIVGYGVRGFKRCPTPDPANPQCSDCLRMISCYLLQELKRVPWAGAV